MKNYIVYALIFALSLPLFQSCSKDDDGAGSGPAHDRITFALTSEAPVAEYPGTQVSYTFTVEYPAGLSQVVATLDGKEIENSKQVYEDAPVSATYEFRYTLLASQSGRRSISISRPRDRPVMRAASTIRSMSTHRRPMSTSCFRTMPRRRST